MHRLDDQRSALSIKPTPFSATDLAWPHKSRPSKCPARSDSSLDSDSWVQSKSDSSLDSDSRVQSKVGLLLGLGLLGPKQIGLLLGLGLLGPNEIGLLLGLGLLAPRPDRTPKSTPLKTDSYLDSDSVCFLDMSSPGPGLWLERPKAHGTSIRKPVVEKICVVR
jgi:hypothetical protein